jgi:pilus assembly protein CpaB
MNRSLRTVVVVAIAIGLAGVATYLVYHAIQSRPAREVEVAHAYAVVAAHPLALGTRITETDVKVVPWPAANQVPGSFPAIDQVIDRGVVTPIAENEPLTGNNVATKEAGAGLPPTIPPGMRAISVKVNEVIGVAGFVVPGTRVDVMAIVRDNQKSLARVVVSNVQVLAAGTRYDQAMAKEGQAVPSSVVTLMVNPADAELIGLAATEGQLMLTLRNPLDSSVTPSTGTTGTKLVGDQAPPPKPAAPASSSGRRSAAPAPTPTPAPPPPKPPVETIKAGVIKKEIIK